MNRLTLEDKANRASAMRKHSESPAQTIAGDTACDAVSDRYLSPKRHVHNHSVRSRTLIA